MNTVKLLFRTFIATVFLTGCAGNQQYKTIESVCMPNLEKAKAMQAAENVLGRMHFTVEKADTEQGYIRTAPLTAAQWFEFWRSDNVGKFNSAEANLHSIRRIAELNMGQQGEQLCICCNVKTQRLSLPGREVTSSSQVPGMFSTSNSSVQKLKLNREQKKQIAWLDLGKDAELETEILRRIERQIAKQK